ncbi:MAG: Hsp70 family protein [Marinilabiliaceae bacterium]|nr:Hsp70 family protein [Marinilabiliaceae bacterium]
METAIGIDLGTTFSAIATIDEYGKPVVIKNLTGDTLTPSVIYFENANETIVGYEAKERQFFGEENIVSLFKRRMGNENFERSFHGKVFNATDLSSILLKKIKEDAETVLNKKISSAVITVPAYFNDFQRKATINAAENAGLKVLKIINEPTAAAIAFGIKQDKNQTIMVYDLGGGTFDVTIMKIEENVIKVIATGGAHELGGKEWDDRLISYFATKFKEEFGTDPIENKIAFNDLLVKAENTKKQLSTAYFAKFSIVCDGNRGNYEISRSKFEEITEDLLQQTALEAEKTLKEAALNWKDIDGVLLVGGSTKMPAVSEWVERMSGKQPIKGINVDEAVCLGAAICAKNELEKENPTLSLSGKKSFNIEEVMSHSLGMIAENNDRTKYINSIIIPKNKTIPAHETRPYRFYTAKSENNEMEIYLTQCETEIIGDGNIVGKFLFSGIEKTAAGVSIIDVEYNYDKNGTVQIAATQRETQKKLQMRQTPLPEDMSWIDMPPEQQQITVTSRLSVVFAVDLSGSMAGQPLKQAQKAAKEFVNKLDLSKTSVSLMPFADKVQVNQELTQDKKLLFSGIDNWTLMKHEGTVGWGNATHPFDKAADLLKNMDTHRFVIVLTDGMWLRQNIAIEKAKKCAAQGIEIIAIGFGKADLKFLKEIATSDKNAMFTNIDGLVTSFSKIAQVITESAGKLRV